MLEVQGLTRDYGRTRAVSDVSFRIDSNAVVGLLGQNGAGKTTIMRMLSGYLEPTAGRVVVDGLDIAGDTAALQRQLGYLPENSPAYPDMMVADYLEYAATLRGIGRRRRMLAVREAIVATDLGKRALDRVSTLSRGLRQRVGVAQAILGKPRLLILDEPTNGLDPGQTAQMRELIRRLARSATVILSTHIMQEVEAVCDRVLVLREGCLALDEHMDALRHSRTLHLRTDGSAERLANPLERLPDIAAVTHSAAGDGLLDFELLLNDGADADAASNNVARCVVEAGAQLYQLRTLVRDLDTVFREVNRSGD